MVSANSEISINDVSGEVLGVVFYDADCRICQTLLRYCAAPFRRRGFTFLPIQTALASGQYDREPAEFFREMQLLTNDSHWLGGVDAYAEMFRHVAWLRPLRYFLLNRVTRPIAARLYSWIANNRTCLDGRCKIPCQRNRRSKTTAFFEWP